MARCFSASVAASSDLDACGASCLVCQRRFIVEENSKDMVSCLRADERAWQNSSLNCSLRVWFQRHTGRGYLWAPPCTKTMTKWFFSTRLETRTKESNICASSRVGKPACVMKVTAGIFAPATDQSTERGLSMSISVRTRKMVNYACEGQTQGKL